MPHLTGREIQINSILASINKIIKRKEAKRVIFLTGEAGVGKSTLIENLRRMLNERGRFQEEERPYAVYAACTTPVANQDIGSSEALKPWADILQKLINAEEVDTAEKKDFDFKKFMIDSAPSWMKMVPVIGTTLEAAVDIGTKAYGQKKRTDEKIAGSQEQIFQQYVNFLARISEEKPLVIIIDDFHWADDSSTNLLFTAARQFSNKRICFIVTYRADDVRLARDGKGHPVYFIANELQRYDLCEEIALERFTKEQTAEILSIEYKGKGISKNKDFLDWLVEVSEGNGLYITNFLAKLEEEGYIDKASGEVLKDYIDVKAPEDNLALIRSRIKNLPEEEQEVPRYASVEGSTFTMEVLKEILEEKPLKLLQKLRMLEEKSGLIESLGKQLVHTRETTAYRFSHVQVHKAMYESLEEEERELLHQAIFNVLEKEWNTAKEEDINVVNIGIKIASHAEALRNYIFAAETLLESAKETWTTYAAEETLQLIERAFSNISKAEEENVKISQKSVEMKLEGMILTIDIYELKGRWKEAVEIFEKAIILAEEINSKKYISLLNAAIGVVYRMLGDYKNSFKAFDTALAINEELNDKLNIAYVTGCVGVAHFEKGNNAEALKCYQKKLSICEEINDERGIAHVMGAMGNAYFAQGDYKQALEFHQKKLAICEAMNDQRNISFTLGNMGNVYYNLGNYNKALECYERKFQISEAMGDKSNIVTVLGNLGNVFYARGEYEKALEYQNKKIELCEEISEPYGICIALGNIGNIYTAMGDYHKGLEYFEKKLKLGIEMENKYHIINSYGGIGTCYNKLGDNEKSLEYFNLQMPLCVELGDVLNIASCTGNIAVILFEEGQYKEAFEKFSQALKEHRRIGYIIAVQIWLYYLAQIYLEEYLNNEKLPEYLKNSLQDGLNDGMQPREGLLRKAEEFNNESMKVLKEQLGIEEEIINVQFIELRIMHANGNKVKAIEGFKKLLSEKLMDSQKAEIYYRLWQFTEEEKEKRKYADEALSLFEGVCIKTPLKEFKNKIEELKNSLK